MRKLNRFHVCYIFSMIFILSACTQKEPIYKQLGLEKDAPHILFVSNKQNYLNESVYYDALIELKNTFPEDINQLTVLQFQKDDEYLKRLNIEESPCLLIIFNDDILVNISGAVSKEEIIQPVTKTLSQYQQ
jgi:hypothetical protein